MPRSNDSGQALAPGKSPLGRHLGHRGNRTLKWAFIEAAHGAVRKGGQWREMFDRATDGGRRDRGRGYIKVARVLVDVVYAVWRDQRMYKPQIAVGHRTRPGKGRPYHPMVVAKL